MRDAFALIEFPRLCNSAVLMASGGRVKSHMKSFPSPVKMQIRVSLVEDDEGDKDDDEDDTEGEK